MKERDFCYWLKGVLSQIKEGESIDYNVIALVQNVLQNTLDKSESRDALFSPQTPSPYKAPILPYTSPPTWVSPFDVTCNSK